MRKTPQARRYKCRNAGCSNHYDDIIGGDTAFGNHKAGAVCIPCLYADQMVSHGQTIEQVEAVPLLMAQFSGLLARTGWTWEHVKESHKRMAGAVQ
jgi:hypothetical protein